MAKSKRVMRRLILSKLYEHLQDQYMVVYPREMFISGELSIHEIDALLAFKSDPHIEELRHALDRVEADTFGVCISCKAVISQELIDADPAQRVCGSCEQKLVHTAPSRYSHHLTT